MRIGWNNYGVTKFNFNHPPIEVEYVNIAEHINQYKGTNSLCTISSQMPKLDLLQIYNRVPINYSDKFIIDTESTNFMWWDVEQGLCPTDAKICVSQNDFFCKTKAVLESNNCRKIIAKTKYGMELGIKRELKTEAIIDKLDYVYPAAEKVNIHREVSAKVRVLFVGMDFFRKSGLEMLRAFEKLKKNYPNIILNMVTYLTKNAPIDYPMYRSNVENIKEALEIVNRNSDIHLFEGLGREDLYRDVYPNSDIIVFPTKGETFGFESLEAMAHGVPVIATSVGGQPEIIEDNVSGMIIPALYPDNENNRGQNYPNFGSDQKVISEYIERMIIEKLQNMLDNPARTRRMGEESLRIARTKFSYEERNRKLKQIYDEVIQD